MFNKKIKDIAIIGTGISAMSSIEALKDNKNFNITVFESGSNNKKK